MSDLDKKEAPAADQQALEEGVEEPASPEGQIEELRQLLAKKESEAQEIYDRYMRERAELENFKKRMLRERAEERRFACESLIRSLLPVIDNLERAVEHASGGGNGAPLVEGVCLVLKSIEDVLRAHGVSSIDARPGDAFDPSKHEAVARREIDGEPNRVVSQHERGYFLHDRLLRAAKVVVSCAADVRSDVEKAEDDD